uniref:Uncharacterized protein n=1 Tax=Lepeophtheirus salmonis TaxID=72036 RepID=A0A0K2UHU3_LEPSM
MGTLTRPVNSCLKNK